MNELEADLRGPKKARVEIIPLIDVIFFLLATFVLFTLSLQRLKLIDADLPKTHDEKSEDTTAFIQASADGAYYWKVGAKTTAEPITASELAVKLENYKRSVLVPRVFLRSDRQAKLGAAAFALDEVRRAGIKQVAVETISTPTGS